MIKLSKTAKLINGVHWIQLANFAMVLKFRDWLIYHNPRLIHLIGGKTLVFRDHEPIDHDILARWKPSIKRPLVLLSTLNYPGFPMELLQSHWRWNCSSDQGCLFTVFRPRKEPQEETCLLDNFWNKERAEFVESEFFDRKLEPEKPKAKPRKKTTKKAYTLIELLIVVAILAILSSLLFPALIRARATARIETFSQVIKKGDQLCPEDLKQLNEAVEVLADQGATLLSKNGISRGEKGEWVANVVTNTLAEKSPESSPPLETCSCRSKGHVFNQAGQTLMEFRNWEDLNGLMSKHSTLKIQQIIVDSNGDRAVLFTK